MSMEDDMGKGIQAIDTSRRQAGKAPESERQVRRRVEWAIYKKTQGFTYPGEYWDTAKNESHAHRLMEIYYAGSNAFRVVKITYESPSA